MIPEKEGDDLHSHPLQTRPSMESLKRAATQLTGSPMSLRATLTHLNTPYGFIDECNIFSLSAENGEYNMQATKTILSISDVLMMFQGDVVMHFSAKELVA
jgi:hypothetical protein